MRILTLTLTCILFVGCAAFENVQRETYQSGLLVDSTLSDPAAISTGIPASYGRQYSRAGEFGGSMFAEDQASISNDAVEMLLTKRIILPTGSRLAAISLDELQNRHYRSMDRLQRDRKATEPMLAKLKTAKRVRETLLLPALMLGGDRTTLSSLRATAARCQADLLLVYGSDCETRVRTQFFRPRKVTGRCLVEAILLDIRSGTVPLSTNGSATFEYEESDDVAEPAAADAQRKALEQALDEIATKVVRFLDEAP